VYDIQVITPLGDTVTARYTIQPDTCPVCKRACEVKAIGPKAIYPQHGDQAKKKLQLVHRCPRQACGSLFVVEYSARYDSASKVYFDVSALYPRTPAPADIPEGVAEISPKFVEILNQSLAAESHNLDQIVGIGLRKALEFLIKDYCITKFAEKADDVRSQMLGACIKNFAADQNIQSCAKRAAWLGNDETHYSRAWTAHDITDLKVLIGLTQNWIANEVLTAKYLAEMPEKPPGRT